MRGGVTVGCRRLSQCEINSVLADSENALVTANNCCNTVSRNMDAYAVKINGDYRLTLEGSVCSRMMNALANGESVTVKYAGRNCCGMYCVTASGVPDSVTVCGCNRVRISLTDFITDGVLRY